MALANLWADKLDINNTLWTPYAPAANRFANALLILNDSARYGPACPVLMRTIAADASTEIEVTASSQLFLSPGAWSMSQVPAVLLRFQPAVVVAYFQIPVSAGVAAARISFLGFM